MEKEFWGGTHSKFMIRLFPKQNRFGLDLGNVEIKETNGKGGQFALKPKDRKADFILFYSHISEIFYIVNQRDMPEFKKRRSISVKQVARIAYFETGDSYEMFLEMESILKDKKYLE